MSSRNLLSAGVITVLAGLFACQSDESAEPALVTVTVDSTATRFSRLVVVLQNGAAAPDTLFDDSVDGPTDLRHLQTRDYHGGQVDIVLTGYAGNVLVFQEVRHFDGGSPSTTTRDTLFPRPDTLPPNRPLAKPRLPAGNPVATVSFQWGSGGGGGNGRYRYRLDNPDLTVLAVEISDSAYTPAANVDTVQHDLYVQERDSAGNWSATAQFTFRVAQFGFLASMIDNLDWVLAIRPSGDTVRLAHQIVNPQTPAEQSRFQAQLWQKVPDFRGGFYLKNPFTNKVLKQNGGQGPEVTLIDVSQVAPNPTVVWIYGADVAAFGTLVAFNDNNQNMNVAGNWPWDETRTIVLWESSNFEANEMWKLVKSPVKYVY